MKGVSFICGIICLVLYMCTVVLSDYQVEVQLVQYANPTGRISDGQCCDLASGTSCHAAETCDVRITFSPRNLDTNMLFSSETKAIGTYDNTDLIDFPNCAELETFVAAVTNPLTFCIPSSQWTGDDQLRVTADINDVDFVNQRPSFQSIGSPVLDITRPSMPSETFTNDVAIISGSATLTLRYRVICTPETCGSNCSQMTDCPTWTPACTNIDPVTNPPVTTVTSPPNPCTPEPCENGGTCEPISPSTFQCTCREGFTGAMCAEVTTNEPATGTTATPETLQPPTMTTGTTDVEDTVTTGSGASASHYPSQWILHLCTCVIVVLLRLM